RRGEAGFGKGYGPRCRSGEPLSCRGRGDGHSYRGAAVSHTIYIRSEGRTPYTFRRGGDARGVGVDRRPAHRCYPSWEGTLRTKSAGTGICKARGGGPVNRSKGTDQPAFSL